MSPALNKPAAIGSWILQLAVVLILGQALFFKFAGAAETVALFEVVGAEPFGRYAAGTLELAAAALLLIPKTVWLGAVAALIAITGAIGAHITRLGVSIDPEALGEPDLEPLAGPGLFAMAVFVFVAGAAVLLLRRRQVPLPGRPPASGGDAAAA